LRGIDYDNDNRCADYDHEESSTDWPLYKNDFEPGKKPLEGHRNGRCHDLRAMGDLLGTQLRKRGDIGGR